MIIISESTNYELCAAQSYLWQSNRYELWISNWASFVNSNRTNIKIELIIHSDGISNFHELNWLQHFGLFWIMGLTHEVLIKLTLSAHIKCRDSMGIFCFPAAIKHKVYDWLCKPHAEQIALNKSRQSKETKWCQINRSSSKSNFPFLKLEVIKMRVKLILFSSFITILMD